eukprot:gene2948-12955_t
MVRPSNTIKRRLTDNSENGSTAQKQRSPRSDMNGINQLGSAPPGSKPLSGDVGDGDQANNGLHKYSSKVPASPSGSSAPAPPSFASDAQPSQSLTPKTAAQFYIASGGGGLRGVSSQGQRSSHRDTSPAWDVSTHSASPSAFKPSIMSPAVYRGSEESKEHEGAKKGNIQPHARMGPQDLGSGPAQGTSPNPANWPHATNASASPSPMGHVGAQAASRTGPQITAARTASASRVRRRSSSAGSTSSVRQHRSPNGQSYTAVTAQGTTTRGNNGQPSQATCFPSALNPNAGLTASFTMGYASPLKARLHSHPVPPTPSPRAYNTSAGSMFEEPGGWGSDSNCGSLPPSQNSSSGGNEGDGVSEAAALHSTQLNSEPVPPTRVSSAGEEHPPSTSAPAKFPTSSAGGGRAPPSAKASSSRTAQAKPGSTASPTFLMPEAKPTASLPPVSPTSKGCHVRAAKRCGEGGRSSSSSMLPTNAGDIVVVGGGAIGGGAYQPAVHDVDQQLPTWQSAMDYISTSLDSLSLLKDKSLATNCEAWASVDAPAGGAQAASPDVSEALPAAVSTPPDAPHADRETPERETGQPQQEASTPVPRPEGPAFKPHLLQPRVADTSAVALEGVGSALVPQQDRPAYESHLLQPRVAIASAAATEAAMMWAKKLGASAETDSAAAAGANSPSPTTPPATSAPATAQSTPQSRMKVAGEMAVLHELTAVLEEIRDLQLDLTARRGFTPWTSPSRPVCHQQQGNTFSQAHLSPQVHLSPSSDQIAMSPPCVQRHRRYAAPPPPTASPDHMQPGQVLPSGGPPPASPPRSAPHLSATALTLSQPSTDFSLDSSMLDVTAGGALQADHCTKAVSVHTDAHTEALSVHTDAHTEAVSVHTDTHTEALSVHTDAHTEAVSVHTDAHTEAVSVHTYNHTEDVSVHTDNYTEDVPVNTDRTAAFVANVHPTEGRDNAANDMKEDVEQIQDTVALGHLCADGSLQVADITPTVADTAADTVADAVANCMSRASKAAASSPGHFADPLNANGCRKLADTVAHIAPRASKAVASSPGRFDESICEQSFSDWGQELTFLLRKTHDPEQRFEKSVLPSPPLPAANVPQEAAHHANVSLTSAAVSLTPDTISLTPDTVSELLPKWPPSVDDVPRDGEETDDMFWRRGASSGGAPRFDPKAEADSSSKSWRLGASTSGAPSAHDAVTQTSLGGVTQTQPSTQPMPVPGSVSNLDVASSWRMGASSGGGVNKTQGSVPPLEELLPLCPSAAGQDALGAEHSTQPMPVPGYVSNLDVASSWRTGASIGGGVHKTARGSVPPPEEPLPLCPSATGKGTVGTGASTRSKSVPSSVSDLDIASSWRKGASSGGGVHTTQGFISLLEELLPVCPSVAVQEDVGIVASTQPTSVPGSVCNLDIASSWRMGASCGGGVNTSQGSAPPLEEPLLFCPSAAGQDTIGTEASTQSKSVPGSVSDLDIASSWRTGASYGGGVNKTQGSAPPLEETLPLGPSAAGQDTMGVEATGQDPTSTGQETESHEATPTEDTRTVMEWRVGASEGGAGRPLLQPQQLLKQHGQAQAQAEESHAVASGGIYQAEVEETDAGTSESVFQAEEQTSVWRKGASQGGAPNSTLTAATRRLTRPSAGGLHSITEDRIPASSSRSSSSILSQISSDNLPNLYPVDSPISSTGGSTIAYMAGSTGGSTAPTRHSLSSAGFSEGLSQDGASLGGSSVGQLSGAEWQSSSLTGAGQSVGGSMAGSTGGDTVTPSMCASMRGASDAVTPPGGQSIGCVASAEAEYLSASMGGASDAVTLSGGQSMGGVSSAEAESLSASTGGVSDAFTSSIGASMGGVSDAVTASVGASIGGASDAVVPYGSAPTGSTAAEHRSCPSPPLPQGILDSLSTSDEHPVMRTAKDMYRLLDTTLARPKPAPTTPGKRMSIGGGDVSPIRMARDIITTPDAFVPIAAPPLGVDLLGDLSLAAHILLRVAAAAPVESAVSHAVHDAAPVLLSVALDVSTNPSLHPSQAGTAPTLEGPDSRPSTARTSVAGWGPAMARFPTTSAHQSSAGGPITVPRRSTSLAGVASSLGSLTPAAPTHIILTEVSKVMEQMESMERIEFFQPLLAASSSPDRPATLTSEGGEVGLTQPISGEVMGLRYQASGGAGGFNQLSIAGTGSVSPDWRLAAPSGGTVGAPEENLLAELSAMITHMRSKWLPKAPVIAFEPDGAVAETDRTVAEDVATPGYPGPGIHAIIAHLEGVSAAVGSDAALLARISDRGAAHMRKHATTSVAGAPPPASKSVGARYRSAGGDVEGGVPMPLQDACPRVTAMSEFDPLSPEDMAEVPEIMLWALPYAESGSELALSIQEVVPDLLLSLPAQASEAGDTRPGSQSSVAGSFTSVVVLDLDTAKDLLVCVLNGSTVLSDDVQGQESSRSMQHPTKGAIAGRCRRVPPKGVSAPGSLTLARDADSAAAGLRSLVARYMDARVSIEETPVGDSCSDMGPVSAGGAPSLLDRLDVLATAMEHMAEAAPSRRFSITQVSQSSSTPAESNIAHLRARLSTTGGAQPLVVGGALELADVKHLAQLFLWALSTAGEDTSLAHSIKQTVPFFLTMNPTGSLPSSTASSLAGSLTSSRHTSLSGLSIRLSLTHEILSQLVSEIEDLEDPGRMADSNPHKPSSKALEGLANCQPSTKAATTGGTRQGLTRKCDFSLPGGRYGVQVAAEELAALAGVLKQQHLQNRRTLVQHLVAGTPPPMGTEEMERASNLVSHLEWVAMEMQYFDGERLSLRPVQRSSAGAVSAPGMSTETQQAMQAEGMVDCPAYPPNLRPPAYPPTQPCVLVHKAVTQGGVMLDGTSADMLTSAIDGGYAVQCMDLTQLEDLRHAARLLAAAFACADADSNLALAVQRATPALLHAVSSASLSQSARSTQAGKADPSPGTSTHTSVAGVGTNPSAASSSRTTCTTTAGWAQVRSRLVSIAGSSTTVVSLGSCGAVLNELVAELEAAIHMCAEFPPVDASPVGVDQHAELPLVGAFPIGVAQRPAPQAATASLGGGMQLPEAKPTVLRSDPGRLTTLIDSQTLMADLLALSSHLTDAGSASEGSSADPTHTSPAHMLAPALADHLQWVAAEMPGYAAFFQQRHLSTSVSNPGSGAYVKEPRSERLRVTTGDCALSQLSPTMVGNLRRMTELILTAATCAESGSTLCTAVHQTLPPLQLLAGVCSNTVIQRATHTSRSTSSSHPPESLESEPDCLVDQLIQLFEDLNAMEARHSLLGLLADSETSTLVSEAGAGVWSQAGRSVHPLEELEPVVCTNATAMADELRALLSPFETLDTKVEGSEASLPSPLSAQVNALADELQLLGGLHTDGQLPIWRTAARSDAGQPQVVVPPQSAADAQTRARPISSAGKEGDLVRPVLPPSELKRAAELLKRSIDAAGEDPALMVAVQGAVSVLQGVARSVVHSARQSLAGLAQTPTRATSTAGSNASMDLPTEEWMSILLAELEELGANPTVLYSHKILSTSTSASGPDATLASPAVSHGSSAPLLNVAAELEAFMADLVGLPGADGSWLNEVKCSLEGVLFEVCRSSNVAYTPPNVSNAGDATPTPGVGSTSAAGLKYRPSMGLESTYSELFGSSAPASVAGVTTVRSSGTQSDYSEGDASFSDTTALSSALLHAVSPASLSQSARSTQAGEAVTMPRTSTQVSVTGMRTTTSIAPSSRTTTDRVGMDPDLLEELQSAAAILQWLLSCTPTDSRVNVAIHETTPLLCRASTSYRPGLSMRHTNSSELSLLESMRSSLVSESGSQASQRSNALSMASTKALGTYGILNELIAELEVSSRAGSLGGLSTLSIDSKAPLRGATQSATTFGGQRPGTSSWHHGTSLPGAIVSAAQVQHATAELDTLVSQMKERQEGQLQRQVEGTSDWMQAMEIISHLEWVAGELRLQDSHGPVSIGEQNYLPQPMPSSRMSTSSLGPLPSVLSTRSVGVSESGECVDAAEGMQSSEPLNELRKAALLLLCMLELTKEGSHLGVTIQEAAPALFETATSIRSRHVSCTWSEAALPRFSRRSSVVSTGGQSSVSAAVSAAVDMLIQVATAELDMEDTCQLIQVMEMNPRRTLRSASPEAAAAVTDLESLLARMCSQPGSSFGDVINSLAAVAAEARSSDWLVEANQQQQGKVSNLSTDSHPSSDAPCTAGSEAQQTGGRRRTVTFSLPGDGEPNSPGKPSRSHRASKSVQPAPMCVVQEGRAAPSSGAAASHAASAGGRQRTTGQSVSGSSSVSSILTGVSASRFRFGGDSMFSSQGGSVAVSYVSVGAPVGYQSTLGSGRTTDISVSGSTIVSDAASSMPWSEASIGSSLAPSTLGASMRTTAVSVSGSDAPTSMHTTDVSVGGSTVASDEASSMPWSEVSIGSSLAPSTLGASMRTTAVSDWGSIDSDVSSSMRTTGVGAAASSVASDGLTSMRTTSANADGSTVASNVNSSLRTSGVSAAGSIVTSATQHSISTSDVSADASTAVSDVLGGMHITHISGGGSSSVSTEFRSARSAPFTLVDSSHAPSHYAPSHYVSMRTTLASAGGDTSIAGGDANISVGCGGGSNAPTSSGTIPTYVGTLVSSSRSEGDHSVMLREQGGSQAWNLNRLGTSDGTFCGSTIHPCDSISQRVTMASVGGSTIHPCDSISQRVTEASVGGSAIYPGDSISQRVTMVSVDGSTIHPCDSISQRVTEASVGGSAIYPGHSISQRVTEASVGGAVALESDSTSFRNSEADLVPMALTVGGAVTGASYPPGMGNLEAHLVPRNERVSMTSVAGSVVSARSPLSFCSTDSSAGGASTVMSERDARNFMFASNGGASALSSDDASLVPSGVGIPASSRGTTVVGATPSVPPPVQAWSSSGRGSMVSGAGKSGAGMSVLSGGGASILSGASVGGASMGGASMAASDEMSMYSALSAAPSDHTDLQGRDRPYTPGLMDPQGRDWQDAPGPMDPKGRERTAAPAPMDPHERDKPEPPGPMNPQGRDRPDAPGPMDSQHNKGGDRTAVPAPMDPQRFKEELLAELKEMVSLAVRQAVEGCFHHVATPPEQASADEMTSSIGSEHELSEAHSSHSRKGMRISRSDLEDFILRKEALAMDVGNQVLAIRLRDFVSSGGASQEEEAHTYDLHSVMSDLDVALTPTDLDAALTPTDLGSVLTPPQRSPPPTSMGGMTDFASVCSESTADGWNLIGAGMRPLSPGPSMSEGKEYVMGPVISSVSMGGASEYASVRSGSFSDTTRETRLSAPGDGTGTVTSAAAVVDGAGAFETSIHGAEDDAGAHETSVFVDADGAGPYEASASVAEDDAGACNMIAATAKDVVAPGEARVTVAEDEVSVAEDEVTVAEDDRVSGETRLAVAVHASAPCEHDCDEHVDDVKDASVSCYYSAPASPTGSRQRQAPWAAGGSEGGKALASAPPAQASLYPQECHAPHPALYAQPTPLAAESNAPPLSLPAQHPSQGRSSSAAAVVWEGYPGHVYHSEPGAPTLHGGSMASPCAPSPQQPSQGVYSSAAAVVWEGYPEHVYHSDPGAPGVHGGSLAPPPALSAKHPPHGVCSSSAAVVWEGYPEHVYRSDPGAPGMHGGSMLLAGSVASGECPESYRSDPGMFD